MKTFSESWYRVANQCIYLRPGVRVRRQNFRGERWIVLENPFSNQYFRLRPAAYEFVARLQPDRTVEQVWQLCLDRFPDEAPSQEAVIQLLSQLYFANLLQYDLAVDSAQLFQRYKQRKQREIGFQFLNISYMRFPLLDPDRFLVRILPVVGKLISPAGAVLWAIVVGLAVKIAVDNFDALREQGQNVLAPGNLVLLYLGWIFIKTVHEFGHAVFCRKFGGEVHVMGVMLVIFMPTPYVDATSSWSFRERRKRVLVGAAGMIAELFVAALAMFVWARTAPGTLHSLAYDMMVAASVSTVMLNINPLLRYDGYYILSDLLEIPNLNQRANGQLTHLVESKLFGVKPSEGPARTKREAGWLVFYGITSKIYCVIVFGGLLLVVVNRFLIIGMVIAIERFNAWVIVPVVRFIRYLATDPKLERVRPRAIGVAVGGVAAVLILLCVVPFPNSFRAPGVVKAAQRAQVANETAGTVEALLAKPGDMVKSGQPLLKLRNKELDLELAAAHAKLEEVNARLLKAMNDETADVKPLSQLRDSVSERIAKLSADEDHLMVTARQDGAWVAPGVQDFVGRWVPRGADLGMLVNPGAFEFSATVMQEDVDAVFARKVPHADVRLDGDVATELPVRDWRVIPGGQETLPSAALGWRAGGEVSVAQGDNQPNKAAEPFFSVIGKLDSNGKVTLLDGRLGKIRFELPAEPLMQRWARRLWQLFQKRYQI